MASRHGIVSAEAGEDLSAVQRSLAAAPAELKGLLDATAREQLSAAWGEELHRQPATPQQQKFVLAGASARPYAGGLMVRTGESRESLARKFEFGSKNREAVTKYVRRGNSKRRASIVTRHATRQMPEYKAGGYIAYPAANKLGSRVFAMWAQLIRKVIHDATEGTL